MKKWLGLLVSYGAIGAIGFTLGLYMLPILMAPPSPTTKQAWTLLGDAEFQGSYRRDLKDSDFLHWGEGTAFVSRSAIFLEGELAPGPDYKMYLSPRYLETEEEFLRVKSSMVRIGDIKSFGGVVLPVPSQVDVTEFNTVIVWCETFSQFITAAKYK